MAAKFTGKPLTKDAVLTLLQNGVADAQVRRNVEQRGVSFKPTAGDKSEIRKSGGSVALVNLIAASFVDPNQNNVSNNDTGDSGNSSGAYDNLVDKAVAQYDTDKNPAASIATLQQAVKLDPNQARAYQLLGFSYLYSQKNFAEAEKYMNEALNRGGSAVFRVHHDHDGMFAESCQGSLYIAKDTVRFESDDNKHTFETTDANIKQVKMNSLFKSFYKTKSGSFKIVLKSGETDSVKFSFAPLTDNALESKMIIRLIGKAD
jgi:tetratricopeptide (TPR) repeat protein